MSEFDDDWEDFLRRTQGEMPKEMRGPLIDVADTAYACRIWLMTYFDGGEVRPQDVLTMAGMVMSRESENPVSESESQSDAG